MIDAHVLEAELIVAVEAARLALAGSRQRSGETLMLVLGLILLVVGYIVPIPLLATIGWILLLVGLVLFLLGSVGRPVGGRRYWF